MGALAWVEVLDRRGHVHSRHRIDTMPALIGRSYGCDVLIDDPWISPIHVRVYRDLDGSFKVEDAGSENGLWSPGRPGRVTLLPLGTGLTLRAGRTTFRIVPADAMVPPALATHASAPAEGGWEQGWVAAAAGAVAGGVYGFTRLLGDADVHRPAQLLGDALMMALVLAIWAGAWALATRAIWHRARFLAHFIVVAVAVVAMMAVVAGVEYAAFIAPGVPGFEGAIILLSFVVATGLVYGHLTIATALSKARVAAISTAIIFGLAALAALMADGEGPKMGGSMPQFSAELKPLRTGIIPVQDTTDFFAGLKELKTSVDSLARDPN
jgi:FHA domain-containing protein